MVIFYSYVSLPEGTVLMILYETIQGAVSGVKLVFA
jgi:hypothetical protein